VREVQVQFGLDPSRINFFLYFDWYW